MAINNLFTDFVTTNNISTDMVRLSNTTYDVPDIKAVNIKNISCFTKGFEACVDRGLAYIFSVTEWTAEFSSKYNIAFNVVTDKNSKDDFGNDMMFFNIKFIDKINDKSIVCSVNINEKINCSTLVTVENKSDNGKTVYLAQGIHYGYADTNEHIYHLPISSIDLFISDIVDLIYEFAKITMCNIDLKNEICNIDFEHDVMEDWIIGVIDAIIGYYKIENNDECGVGELVTFIPFITATEMTVEEQIKEYGTAVYNVDKKICYVNAVPLRTLKQVEEFEKAMNSKIIKFDAEQLNFSFHKGLTEEQLAMFGEVAIRLSPQALTKAKSLGKDYTTILSRILETALADNEIIKQYL